MLSHKTNKKRVKDKSLLLGSYRKLKGNSKEKTDWITENDRSLY